MLEVPFRRVGVTPRHWKPFPLAGPPERIETGVIQLETLLTPQEIVPYSVLAIDFAKAMVDLTGQFNEAVTLPNDGFLTIGESSGYAAAYLPEAVEMYRDPDGVREAVPIWGTWARKTLEPNTTLRLLSSEPFGDDGSISDWYLDGQNLNYCGEPMATEQFVTLAGVKPVYGWLNDGSLYELLINQGDVPRRDLLILGDMDQLTIHCRVNVGTAQVEILNKDGTIEGVDVKANPDGFFTIRGDDGVKPAAAKVLLLPWP